MSPLTISDWLQSATNTLRNAGIDSARLDAEIIIAHTLLKNRTYLHAHGDELLDPHRREIADARVQLRTERTPIAYIVGHKEFYGRLFRVTPATLIPRPESEAIITILRELIEQNKFPEQRLVDVGTGSGCLGITAKLEFPQLHTTLIDISQHALTVTRKNAEKLNADITLLRSDLLESYADIAQYIVANLPYVDPSWQRSPETDHEPSLALFSEDNGLRLIKKLLKQAPAYLAQGGYLILEADKRQHAEIIRIAQEEGFSHHKTEGLIVCLQKR